MQESRLREGVCGKLETPMHAEPSINILSIRHRRGRGGKFIQLFELFSSSTTAQDAFIHCGFIFQFFVVVVFINRCFRTS